MQTILMQCLVNVGILQINKYVEEALQNAISAT